MPWPLSSCYNIFALVMGYHNSQNLGVAPLAPFLKYTYEKYPKAFLSLKLGLVRTQTEIKQFC